jgi:sialidase-1
LQQDLFVGGTDGYHTYRIPSVLTTKKGTVLVFCEGRKNSASDTGAIDLLLKRSTDGGNTWGRQQLVWHDGANTCANPCPVLDEETGTILLLVTHNPGAMSEKRITNQETGEGRTAWLMSSGEDGASWSAPVDITASAKDPAWAWYATGPGIGIQILHEPFRGRLVVPCDHSYTETGTNQAGLAHEKGAHVIYSDDHGKTWKRGGTVRPKMNECQVVELGGGKGALLLTMRNYLNENRRAHCISFNGGISWTSPELDPQLVDPVCQASVLRYDWPTGSGPGRILFSNPASTRRENMTVRMSYDDGHSRPASKTLHPGPSAYSCLVVLPDRTIGCLYERGSTNADEGISFARFPVTWVEKRP